MSEPQKKLAHIIWQAAKFLASLLEKEYQFGKTAK